MTLLLWVAWEIQSPGFVTLVSYLSDTDRCETQRNERLGTLRRLHSQCAGPAELGAHRKLKKGLLSKKGRPGGWGGKEALSSDKHNRVQLSVIGKA